MSDTYKLFYPYKIKRAKIYQKAVFLACVDQTILVLDPSMLIKVTIILHNYLCDDVGLNLFHRGGRPQSFFLAHRNCNENFSFNARIPLDIGKQ